MTFRNGRLGRILLGTRVTSEGMEHSSQNSIEHPSRSQRGRNQNEQDDERLRHERQPGDPQLDPVPPRCHCMHEPQPRGHVRHAENRHRWTPGTGGVDD